MSLFLYSVLLLYLSFLEPIAHSCCFIINLDIPWERVSPACVLPFAFPHRFWNQLVNFLKKNYSWDFEWNFMYRSIWGKWKFCNTEYFSL